jgi:hypothetical protein
LTSLFIVDVLCDLSPFAENKSQICVRQILVDAPWRRPIALNSLGVSCSAREKSQPRNGAGEIFMPAAAEIARQTVSAANRSMTRDR